MLVQIAEAKGLVLMVGHTFDGGAAVVQWDDDAEWWMLDDGKNFEIPLRHERKLIGWLPLPEAAQWENLPPLPAPPALTAQETGE